MAMNLHLLRMFLTVVERQSFSRAAEALHVSQSAVSKGVRELENQLDLPLIERSAGAKSQRGMQLTDSGQALYEHARGIFAMERIAIEDIRDRIELRKGRLRIGASTTVAGYWLPARIAEFVRRHPGIEFDLTVANTGEIGHAIVDGRIDAGFVEGKVDDARIEANHWRSETLLLVAAQASPVGGRRRPTTAELSKQTWLVREPGSGTRQVTQSLIEAHAIAPKTWVEIGSNEAIARAVAAGAGVAVLPEVVVADLIAIGRLRKLRLDGGGDLVRPLFRLELANRPRSPALQSFLDAATP
jgi:LysR family transcriptional regulator, transcriptional activator of the cysJI operon